MEQKDPLGLPSPEVLQQIAEKQDARAKERKQRLQKLQIPQGDDRSAAAKLIQKNYRGYRTRRALQGHALDANARWIEV